MRKYKTYESRGKDKCWNQAVVVVGMGGKNGILFIHSLVNGHVGCFYMLAVMNNAVRNICVWVFMWIYSICFYFSWVYLRVELLGPMVILCLTFWGTAQLFSVGPTVHSYHLSTSCQYSGLVWLLDSSKWSGCEVVSHCGICLVANAVEHLCICLVVIFIYILKNFI